MKKFVKYLLALVLFIPIMVSAQDVSIKSITLAEKKGYVEEVSPAKAEGLKVQFDLNFHEVGDEATYLLLIHNGDSEDYVLDTKLGVDSKYVEYSLDTASDNVIKAGGDTKVYITAKYKTEVPTYMMTENKYSETKNIKINLVGDVPSETSKNAVNPNTGNPIVILVVGLLIAGVSIIALRKYNVGKYTSMVLIMGLVLVPTTIMALKAITIDVDSKVQVEKVDLVEFTVISYEENEKEYNYKVLPGTTWEEFLNSDLNKDNIKLDDISGQVDFPSECKFYYFIYDETNESGPKGVGRMSGDGDDEPAYDNFEELYRNHGGVFPNDEIKSGGEYLYDYSNPCGTPGDDGDSGK